MWNCDIRWNDLKCHVYCRSFVPFAVRRHSRVLLIFQTPLSWKLRHKFKLNQSGKKVIMEVIMSTWTVDCVGMDVPWYIGCQGRWTWKESAHNQKLRVMWNSPNLSSCTGCLLQAYGQCEWLRYQTEEAKQGDLNVWSGCFSYTSLRSNVITLAESKLDVSLHVWVMFQCPLPGNKYCFLII